MEEKVRLNVRVERELLDAFMSAARQSGSNASAAMRERIRNFVAAEKRKQARLAARNTKRGSKNP